jgi:hypothetical protein
MSDVLRSYDELFPLGPRRRGDVRPSDRPELDLQNFRELRLDLYRCRE